MNFQIQYSLRNDVTGYYDDYTYIFTSNLTKRTLRRIYRAGRWVNLQHNCFEMTLKFIVELHKVGYEIQYNLVSKTTKQSKHIVSKKNNEYMKSIIFSF